MTRALLTELVFFLTPFVVFFIYLALRRRNPLTFSAWEKSIPALALVGAVLVAGSLLWAGITAERSTGSYVPPQVQNGQVEPGRFE
ncbi:MAG: hypothetical protein EA385_04000 [Salinarimonadaceae bacterium]|nr:MAG: hypothetical protein EA385_04000 [Salinarimonadaceae bacterium]